MTNFPIMCHEVANWQVRKVMINMLKIFLSFPPSPSTLNTVAKMTYGKTAEGSWNDHRMRMLLVELSTTS